MIKLIDTQKEIKNKVVVRLSTECWISDRGIHIKKNINWLKRKSIGFNILIEEADYCDVADIFERIINIDNIEDGIYEVVICNEVKDWETGMVEDYDFKLIEVKYEKGKTSNTKYRG